MRFGLVAEKQAVCYDLLAVGRRRARIVRVMDLFGLVAEAVVVESRIVCAGCCLEACCVVALAGFHTTTVFAGLEVALRSMIAAVCLASLAGIRTEL
jgi:hypothetical protein